MIKNTLCFLILTLVISSYNMPGRSNSIGETSFTINEDGLMLIELRINKVKVSRFVLDSGASVTILDDDIASQLHLSVQEKNFESTGASGISNYNRKTDKQHISITKNVSVDGIELHVRDLSHLGNINGIIGFDLFRNFVSKIDFDSSEITFYKKKAKPDTDGFKAVNFTESFCTPEIEIAFELENGDKFDGKAFFDTGNTASPLIVNALFKKERNLSSKFQRLITSGSHGIHSETKMNVGIVKTLSMGGYKLGEMPVTLSNAEKGVLSWEGYIGLLGLEYISRFNFIIDYHRKKIYLKPSKSYSNSFKFPLSGIQFKEENNKIFIDHVTQYCDAYKFGLREGQQLISVNGEVGESKSYYKNLLKMEGEEATIIVRQENDELKTVTILLKRLI